MITIQWCGHRFELRRVILAPDLEESEEIQRLSALLRLCVLDSGRFPRLRPEAGDLWVGCYPSRGWEGLAGSCGWARTYEGPIVVQRLQDAEKGHNP